MRTEAWWVCTCGARVCKKGSGDLIEKWEAHVRTDCESKRASESARDRGTYKPFGMNIKQLPQTKR